MSLLSIDADEGNFGPAMARLTAKQRAFVIVNVESPWISASAAARKAGYGGGFGGSKEWSKKYAVHRQCAYQLIHDEKIIAAIQEECSRRFRSSGAIIGLQVMSKIALTDGHKDQLRAANMLASRAGFHSVQEHRVTHTDQTGEEMVEKIRRLAMVLGVDPARLLGGNVEPVKVIEHREDE